MTWPTPLDTTILHKMSCPSGPTVVSPLASEGQRKYSSENGFIVTKTKRCTEPVR